MAPGHSSTRAASNAAGYGALTEQCVQWSSRNCQGRTMWNALKPKDQRQPFKMLVSKI